MKILNAIAGLGLLAMASSASATVMTMTGFSEGIRDQVAGTTVIDPTDVPSVGGFDLGSLTNVGDMITLHGRIVNAVDAYEITSETAFTVSFIFGGVALEAGGMTDTSGFVYDDLGGDVDNTAVFSLTGSMDEMIMTEVTSGDPLIFSAGPGSYSFAIDGSGGGALYDIKFTAVPVPAALPLLLGGIGMLGVFGRKKKAELA